MPKPQPFGYEIKALADPGEAEVLLFGEIGASWDDTAIEAGAFVRALGELKADKLLFRINSNGGSVSDALAMFTAIKSHPAGVKEMRVDGVAVSAASMLAFAGTGLPKMFSSSLLMIHAPWALAGGDAEKLRAMADTLDQYAAAMAEAYAAGTGKPVAEMLALLKPGKDHWFTAAEAQAAGMAEILPGVNARASLDLTRYNPPARVAALLMEPEMSKTNQATEPVATPDTPNPQAAQPIDEAAIRAAGAKAEAERRTGILALVKNPHDPAIADTVQACLADLACSPEQAGMKILAKMAEGAEPVAKGGYAVFTHGEDQRDKTVQACADSLLARAAVPAADGKRRDIAANPYRGQSLLDMARASLGRAGVRHEGMDKRALVAAAFTHTTSDFPVLLENAMHKALQTAYATAADTWSRYCAVGSVSDFRAHNRYRLGSFGSLATLTEAGEFREMAIPDGEKSSITAGTKGRIITITRQAIINDDLGAFVGLAQKLGRAARRTIEEDVYALLALNSGLGPTMSDTYTLFHANHGNIGTGAALTVASLDADRAKMAMQKDPSSNEYLDLRPAVWLGPIASGSTARVLNNAEYDPDTANKLQKPNAVRGLFRDVVDTPRISGTRYYLFADPMDAPVIEVAFLDGVQEPFLDTEEGFSVDGARYKVRLDYGVAAIDYRGAVTNAGTA